MKTLKRTLVAAMFGVVGLALNSQAAEVQYGYTSLASATGFAAEQSVDGDIQTFAEVHLGYTSLPKATREIIQRDANQGEALPIWNRMVGPGLIASQS